MFGHFYKKKTVKTTILFTLGRTTTAVYYAFICTKTMFYLKKTTSLTLFILLCSQTVFSQNLLRYPAISPDGSRLAFSFQGDIWQVPLEGAKAQRMTIHEAYEAMPKWSLDGQNIAFQSNRYGNNDIFVMSAERGNPMRLTYNSASENIGDWTPSGQILFHTKGIHAEVEWDAEIHSVAAQGGTSFRLLDAFGTNASVSPDGRFIAFMRGPNDPYRKRYRGYANKQIWLYDTQNKTYQRITTFEGNCTFPDWGGNRTLYFVSEIDETYNIYALDLSEKGEPNGSTRQITKLKTDGVRNFDVSLNGKQLVFEADCNLYRLDPQVAGSNPQKLNIELFKDERFDPIEYQTFRAEASEYALNSSENLLALVVRGEVFVTENDKEKSKTVRLTRHAYFDRDIAWLSDSVLVFASDREGGQYDLYAISSADPKESNLFKTLKHKTTRLTNTPDNERAPVVSPDGKTMLFMRNTGTLVAVAIDDAGQFGKEKELMSGWANPSGLRFSPDSKWLTFSMEDLNFNEEVYIMPADASAKPLNISQHPRTDTAPVWSPDGSKLVFLSARNNNDLNLWFVWLKKADAEKTKTEWEEEKDEAPKDEPKKDAEPKDKKAKADSSKSKKPTVTPIVIDLEGISNRVVQVTSLPGNETDLAVAKDGKTFFFVNNRAGRESYNADNDLYSIKWDGKALTALTQGNYNPYGVQLSPSMKYLYMMKQGGMVRIATDAGKTENLPYAAQMEINHPQEMEQMFEEGWRIMRDNFYDPDFHGVNWSGIKAKYKDWALKASTKKDFRDMFNLMLGELNASHLGMYGGDREEVQFDQTGLLGIEIEPNSAGVRITRVLKGSPAHRSVSKLEVGDIITAVNGVPINVNQNFYALLNKTANQKVLLSVNATNGTAREVVIRPVSNLFDALYENWIEERKKLTEKYSKGKVGYIHIQGMDWESYERFERELVASCEGKEAVVIDVRYNGGGWTTDYLMSILSTKQHAYTIPRGAAKNLEKDKLKFKKYYPYGERLPMPVVLKPVATICNQNSYSNAEIFSHAFKTLKMGKLVGIPTFGAVISTGGTNLIDGSLLRMPYRAWFSMSEDKNMENGPAVPDFILENTPDHKGKQEDQQLQKAVDELLKDIK